jgi:Transposase zinc-binding domain
MARPALEVADVFRDHGAAWRHANRGHVSLLQLKVMSAIENCRTAALGGHVARCEDCAHTTIAYNSCRNRHCPKCQGAAAQKKIIGSIQFFAMARASLRRNLYKCSSIRHDLELGLD